MTGEHAVRAGKSIPVLTILARKWNSPYGEQVQMLLQEHQMTAGGIRLSSSLLAVC